MKARPAANLLTPRLARAGGLASGVLLLLVALAGCDRDDRPAGVAPTDPRIVGAWTMAGGDYPLTDEYRADGMLVQTVRGRTMEPHPFRIEGEFIIVSVKQPDGTAYEQKDRFTLKDDTLTFTDSNGSKRVFRRDRRG